MIARAIALRPKLVEQQAEVEERTTTRRRCTRSSARGLLPAVHPAALRRLRVRRADVHARRARDRARVPVDGVVHGRSHRQPRAAGRLVVAASGRRRRSSATADFRAASVAAPIGAGDDGRRRLGAERKVAYASGIPYSTHYMGQALLPDATSRDAARCSCSSPRRASGRCSTTGATCSASRAAGSHSIVFDGGRIPAHWVLEDTSWSTSTSSDGTPGLELHGNPMYGGRAIGPLHDLAGRGDGRRRVQRARRVRGADGRTKTTPLPPFVPRKLDPDYQR